MKEEMAFLKYRREVVQAWPESPRKAVFLTAIESRLTNVQQQLLMVSSTAEHAEPVNSLGQNVQMGRNVPNWNGSRLQYRPFTSPPSTAIAAPVM